MDKTVVIGILDDDKSTLQEIEKHLEKSDYQAFLTENPETLLKWIDEDKIDIIASDFNLNQKVNGLDIIQQIRNRKPGIPALLYSSGSNISLKRKKEIEDLNIKIASSFDFLDSVTETLDDLKKDNQPQNLKRSIDFLKDKPVIKILISCPSDVFIDEEKYISILERRFRKKSELYNGKRIEVEYWKDLPSRIGNAQDIINDYIKSNIDIVISVFKHKIGSVTKNSNGQVRNQSGTVEELKIAIRANELNKLPLGMLYFHSEEPHSLEDNSSSNTFENWEKLQEFKKDIETIVTHKKYEHEDSLVNIIIDDIMRILA